MIRALVEEELEPSDGDETAQRRECGVGDREEPRARVGQPTGDHREDERLGGPRDRERRVREQVRGSHRAEAERGGPDHEGEIGLLPEMYRDRDHGPHACRGKQRRTALAALVEDLDREDQRDRERRERVAERERVDLVRRGDELPRDGDSEQRERRTRP